MDNVELPPDAVKELRRNSTLDMKVPEELTSPNSRVGSPKAPLSVKGHLNRRKLTVTGELFACLQDMMPTRASNVLAALILEKPVRREDVIRVAEERLMGLERFRSRVVTVDGQHYFEGMPSTFKAGDNITEEKLRSDSRAEVLKQVEQIFLLPFDSLKPPWEMHLLQSPSGRESVLLFRVSHLIGDGSSLVLSLIALTDDLPEEDQAASSLKKRQPPPGCFDACLSSLKKAISAVPSFCTVMRGIGAPPEDDCTLLRPPVGGADTENKRFCTFSIPLDLVKESAKRAGATVNELAIAALGGAMRRYMLEKKDPLLLSADSKGGGYPKQTAMCLVGLAVSPAMLMYNTVDPTQIVLRNKICAVDIPLPLHPTKEARIGTVVAASKQVKESLVPECGAFIFPQLLKLIGPQKLVEMLMGQKEEAPKKCCVITNVPGPQRSLLLAGTQVKEIAFWNNPAENRFTCGIFSYCGTMCVSFTWHPELLDGECFKTCLCEEWYDIVGKHPVSWE